MTSSYDIDDPDFDAWGDDNVEDLLEGEAETVAAAGPEEAGFDEPSYEDLITAPASREAAPQDARIAPSHDRERLRSLAREAAKRLLRDHVATILPHALQQAGLLAYRAPAERARLHQACMRGLSVELPVCAGRLFARNDLGADAASGAPRLELPVAAVLACTSARLARRFRSELTKQDTDALVAAIADLIPERVLRLDQAGRETAPAPSAPAERIRPTDQLAQLRRTLVEALEKLDELAGPQSRRAL